MNHILFTPEESVYTTAILIKPTAFNHSELLAYYAYPLSQQGIPLSEIIAFDLQYSSEGKAPVKLIKSYLGSLLPVLDGLEITSLLVADPGYFKVLTGKRKTSGQLGYMLSCAIKGFEHIQVTLTPNYTSLFHDPTNQSKIDMAIETLAKSRQGFHLPLGSNVIHSEAYPESLVNIGLALNKLHEHPALTCDIEAFSLDFYNAGIGTIAFAWDEHNGLAFAIDYEKEDITKDGIYGWRLLNPKVKELLKNFFDTYQGELIFHNSGYDVAVLIYELYMDSFEDYEGLLTGIDVLTKNLLDTKIEAFLATNTTAGNVLGLKEISHAYMGNYGEENINDIRKIPLDKLLTYNLKDCLATFWSHNKYYPMLIADNQLDIYETIMLPSMKVLLNMALVGMPMNHDKINETDIKLTAIRDKYLDVIQSMPMIAQFTKQLQAEERTKDLLTRQSKAKKPENIKVKDIDKFTEPFNPNSGLQVAKLVYEFMGFEITDTTDSGAPSTKGKVLEKLLAKHMSEHNLTEEDIQ